MDNYYELLGVKKNATMTQISKAYKKLALKLHPDKGGNDYLFRKVNEAYKVLSNKRDRYNYDTSHQIVSKDNFSSSLFDMMKFDRLFDIPSFDTLFDMTNINPKNSHYYSETIESVYHNGKGTTKKRINNNGKINEYWL